MSRKIRKIKNQLALSFIIIILGATFIFLLISTFTAKTTGTELGTSIGEKVGKVTGAAEALVSAEKYFEEGKDIGTEARYLKIKEITQSIKIKKELTILEADVSIDDILSIGGDEKNKYKALIIWEGTVRFKVDLSKVKVKPSNDNKTLKITIPEPTAELVLNSNKTLDESVKPSWLDADKGSKAYNNSRKKIENNAKNEIENYDNLMNIAKLQAKEQVIDLIEELSFADNVVVEFDGGER